MIAVLLIALSTVMWAAALWCVQRAARYRHAAGLYRVACDLLDDAEEHAHAGDVAIAKALHAAASRVARRADEAAPARWSGAPS